MSPLVCKSLLDSPQLLNFPQPAGSPGTFDLYTGEESLSCVDMFLNVEG